MSDSTSGVRLSVSISLLVLALLGWSLVYKLDVASYASGSVIPAGQVKKVQHLEGGIVKSILVQEGQKVEAGDVIAELETVATGAEVGELQNNINALRITLARIIAQIESRKPEFDKQLVAAEPDLAEDAVTQAQTFSDWFDATLERFDAKIAQIEAEINESVSRISGLKKKRSLVAKQVSISRNLLKNNATSEFEHLQLEKELVSLDADIDLSAVLADRLKISIQEEQSNRRIFVQEELLELRQEYEDATVELRALEERYRTSADLDTRTTLRAPVAGTILTMFIKNTGAVVPPGGTIATLVPEDEQLLLEAQLPVSEVGYVQIGTRARISMASGSSGFDTIEGELVQISPDAVVDEQTGASHYLVRIKPEVLEFTRNGVPYPLTPGVQVMAALITGERSVMELLLDPFVGSAVRPLSER